MMLFYFIVVISIDQYTAFKNVTYLLLGVYFIKHPFYCVKMVRFHCFVILLNTYIFVFRLYTVTTVLYLKCNI